MAKEKQETRFSAERREMEQGKPDQVRSGLVAAG